MTELRYRSQGKDVFLLTELLEGKGYDVLVSQEFGEDVDRAVREYQLKSDLVVDGKAGPITWASLLEGVDLKPIYEKSLSEKDLKRWALRHELDLPIAKALNASLGLGRGYLVSGKPCIFFHGDVFWKELEFRGMNPSLILEDRFKDVLYKRRTQKFYRGGEAEYDRLERALSMSESRIVKTSAYCAATWGSYQILGSHFNQLGFDSMPEFVDAIKLHEKEQLKILGKLLEFKKNRDKTLLEWLRERNWRKFSRAYYPRDSRAARRLSRELKKSHAYYLKNTEKEEG